MDIKTELLEFFQSEYKLQPQDAQNLLDEFIHQWPNLETEGTELLAASKRDTRWGVAGWISFYPPENSGKHSPDYWWELDNYVQQNRKEL